MDGRPPRRTARAHRAFRLGLLVVGLLVACVAMMAATDTSSAQGAAVTDSGRHVPALPQWLSRSSDPSESGSCRTHALV